MKHPIEVLLVDDHTLMTEGYSNILQNMDGYKFNFTTANDCESAVNLLSDSGGRPFDLILLDISLPGASKLKIFSGEDLGIFIRQNFPEMKIVIMTMHSENFRLYSILKTINPEGFLWKSDVTSEEVKLAVQQVLNRKNFYSHTIKKFLYKKFQSCEVFLGLYDTATFTNSL